jgi:hypothetical protein
MTDDERVEAKVDKASEALESSVDDRPLQVNDRPPDRSPDRQPPLLPSRLSVEEAVIVAFTALVIVVFLLIAFATLFKPSQVVMETRDRMLDQFGFIIAMIISFVSGRLSMRK